MTVLTQTARSGPYVGNDVADSFTFDFRILAEEDLRVTKLDAVDVESVLVLGADYSVIGAGNPAGGTVVLTAPLASGCRLVLTRSVSFTQESDLENQGAFLAETHERAWDKLTMMVQQLDEEVGRSLRAPITDEAIPAVNFDAVVTVSGVTANVSTVAAISNEIVTVAADSANIQTVAQNIATVSSITADITATAAISSEIVTVAGNTANIQTVAENIGEITAAVVALRDFYPVGSLYFNASDGTNPGTLLGFGTWAKFGEGRMVIGHSAAAGPFDTAGNSGGAASVTLSQANLPSHSHSFSATTGSAGSHSHSGTANSAGSHTHSVPFTSSTAGAGNPQALNDDGSSSITTSSSGTHTHSLSIDAAGSHAHSVSGATGTVGSGIAHENMPPYIVVYIWQRIA